MAFFLALMLGVQSRRRLRAARTARRHRLARATSHRRQRPHRRHPRRAATPTATFPKRCSLDNNWIRNPKAPPTFLPTPQEFEALMSQLGISNTTRVIAYDERGGIYAARLWWILNYYGHSNVALLDGGWVKWSRRAARDERRGADAGRGVVQGEAGHGEGRDRRSGEGGDQQAGREADRRAHAGRDRRQGPAQHQARRLHRVVRAGLLGRHARSGDEGVQAGRRDREALSRQGHHGRRTT